MGLVGADKGKPAMSMEHLTEGERCKRLLLELDREARESVSKEDWARRSRRFVDRMREEMGW